MNNVDAKAHARSKGKKSTVVTLADIKANVEAKAPGEMNGDLQKWALVSNGLHA